MANIPDRVLIRVPGSPRLDARRVAYTPVNLTNRPPLIQEPRIPEFLQLDIFEMLVYVPGQTSKSAR